MVEIQKNIFLRFVEQSDCEKLFNWRNDFEVRNLSGNKEELSFEKHKKWFDNSLQDKNILIFIILNEEYKEIGQVRFNNNIISISLDKTYRGNGYGTISLTKSSEIFLKYFKYNDIIAKIRNENISSIKSFEKAGYKLFSSDEEFKIYKYEK